MPPPLRPFSPARRATSPTTVPTAAKRGARPRVAAGAGLLLATLLIAVLPAHATLPPDTAYVAFSDGPGFFALSAAGHAAPLYADPEEHPGVVRALRALQADIGQVTRTTPNVVLDRPAAGAGVVLVGTLGRSATIDGLVRDGKLDVSDVAGRWETFLVTIVEQPFAGVERALVIAGSDKRGTIFGLYDLAERIGVSPWSWWADVPVPPRPALYVRPGRHTMGEPAVTYRGLFINDENPALLGWVNETFGGFNHRFYERVFELILRLKGNLLWPAMWGKAFSDDDPLNPKLADEYGIVISTSHHEPMMRAHVEWERYGSGLWNYETNPEVLRAFWREGIERMGDYESLVTIGMRGDGDEPMTEGTAIALLERIVADQRRILADVTGRAPAETPQVWALYKEVQDYYDRGMRVPDDVTLLFADDNWGNIRRLPPPGAPPRAGGYGVYYHFDYVGGPRSYKWINTTQIERVWEQMHLAYRHGADRIWIVNVGDIKPMEFPLDFFLDYAWDPEAWPAERLPAYYRLWAEQQFGPNHAADIAEILQAYTRFNSRRKPELLAPDTYDLVHFREAERVVDAYAALAERAERIYEALPAAYRDAYYQLVLFPVQAGANLNALYATVARNRLYARQGRAATNTLARQARKHFARDAELTRTYHEDLAGGKWNHMMSQTHIGYTYWQQPDVNVMPEVEEITLPAEAEMGVAVEGSDDWWPASDAAAVLPPFDPFLKPTRYLEIFNRGRAPFDYTIEAGEPWVRLEPARGRVDDEQRVHVAIDWDRAPLGSHRVPITVSGPDGRRAVVYADLFNPAEPRPEAVEGFVESNGYVSIEAEHFSRAVPAGDVAWQRIPGLGRTASAMMPSPVTASSRTPGGDGPRLEYRIHLFHAGEVTIRAYLSPTLDVHDTGGLRYAVSIDDEAPQVVNLHEDTSLQAWERWVSDNVNIGTSRHRVDAPGPHVVKFWMVDPGVVLQKLVVETGDVPSSYLGPPESFHRRP